MPFCESSILEKKKVFLFSSNKYYQLMFINISPAFKLDCFLFQQWLKMTTMLKIITLIFVVMCSSVLNVYPCITCTHGILRCKKMALESPELEIQRVVSWHMGAENTVLYEQSVFLSAGPAPAPPCSFWTYVGFKLKAQGFWAFRFCSVLKPFSPSVYFISKKILTRW